MMSKTIFEKLIGDLSRQDAADLLDDCMSFDPKKAVRIPLRYRILALGFIKKWSVKEVNQKLNEAGCEQLYARNFQEATLIYAYKAQMSYPKWKELHLQLNELERQIPQNGRDFSEKNITLQALKDYLERGSVNDLGQMETRHQTRLLQNQIGEIEDTENFYRFMEQNIREFSAVREKSRYYFCKYLFYYIDQKIKAYTQSLEHGFGTENAAENLLLLKGISDLGRKKYSPKEAEELLWKASLSCGGLYDLFNQFYFEYISSDWMDILLEYYGNISSLPDEAKVSLAASLRHYNPAWKNWTDEAVIREKYLEMEEKEKELDEIYSREGSNRGYQKNRSGEKSVRNYIRGSLDIDRTTLIAYLLFLGYELDIPDDQKISIERLNAILAECRMSELSSKRDFDFFVMEYLKADDPQEYLMETVTNYAFEEKNFFLYHMYNESISNDKQNQKILG